MPQFVAEVDVMLKEGISDPQGQTIERALPALGYPMIGGVRVGKHIRLEIEADDESHARDKVAALCDVLLANPVIESYSVHIASVDPGSVHTGSVHTGSVHTGSVHTGKE